MSRYFKTTIVSILCVGVLGMGVYYFANTKAPHVLGRIGGHTLTLEVADTEDLRARGLSAHRPLSDEEGMLFVFPQDGDHSFWMKDMLFPIDIIWFDSAYRLVYVAKNVRPETFPEIFSPGQDTRYVLEVRSGFFDDHRLETGNILEILK